MPRLDQLLARNLGCSRSAVTRLLREGAIADASGQPLRDGRLAVALTELPVLVHVDDVPLTLREHLHLMLHKPVGVVTSREDPMHPTAWALLDGAPLHEHLRAIGRLDLDAAGLLLWTTDTPLVHALTHPKRAIPRTYEVALARPFAPPAHDDDGRIVITLADGLRPRITQLDGLDPQAAHPALGRPAGTTALARITLLDGAYHEVKRIFAALGSHVLLLLRVAHAGVELPHDLAPGRWRELDTLRPP